MKLNNSGLALLIALTVGSTLFAMEQNRDKGKDKVAITNKSETLPSITLKFDQGQSLTELKPELALLYDAFKAQYDFNNHSSLTNADAHTFDLSKYS